VGTTSDLTVGTNWTPTTVPTGIATFNSTATSFAPTLASGESLSLGEFLFTLTNPHAYTFTLNSTTGNAALTFTGVGIDNASGLAQTFNVSNNATVNFTATSSADSTDSGLVNFVLANNGSVSFQQTANTTFGGAITGSSTGTGTGSGLNINLGTAGTTLTLLNTVGGNTFTGFTNIEQGTLAAGSTGSLPTNSDIVLSATATLNTEGFANQVGSITGPVGSTVNLSGIGGTLSLGDTSSTTFAGQITGLGGLTKLSTSTGTLTLSGTTNNYTGTTTLLGGTLQAGGTNAFSAGSPVVLNAGTTLSLNNHSNLILSLAGTGGTVSLGSGTLTTEATTGTTTFAGSITGTGGFTSAGGATLILSGDTNSYSGLTTLTAGTLQAGANGSFSPSSSVVLAAGAELNDLTYTNTIGALTGTGGTVNVGTGGVLTFGNATNSAYAGLFTGTGTLTYDGTGTFDFTGTGSAFTGALHVNAGTFQLNTALDAATTTVASGAILSGGGTLTGTLAVTGTVAPATTAGGVATLSVGGYTPATGSTYDVLINGTTNSKITVNGTADLAGNGTVDVALATGGTYDVSTPYTIVNATTVTGTFAGVTDPTLSGLLVIPTLSYTPTTVVLDLAPNLVVAGYCPSAYAVATVLDGITTPTPTQLTLLNALVSLTPDEAFAALTALSGEEHFATPLVAELANRQFIRRLFDPIRSIVVTDPNCRCVPYDPCLQGIDAWFEVGGSYFSLDKGCHGTGGGNIDGVQVTGGVQKTFCEEITAGLAVSYEYDDVHHHYSSGNKNNYNTWLVGFYGVWRPANYYVLADLAYSNTRGHLTRNIAFDGLAFTNTSRPEIDQFTFYAEAGFDYPICNFLVQPFFGIETDTIWRKRLVENSTSPDIGLIINKNDRTLVYSRLGTHLTSADFLANAGFSDLLLSLDLAWLYRFEKHAFRQNVQFASVATPFDVYGRDPGRNAFEIALTGTQRLCDGWSVYGEVAGEIWEHAGQVWGLAGIEYSW
jgi:autotransporter-associated beta strand protein